MTLQKVTKKVTMKVKRIVNVDHDLVYIVHHVKVCGSAKGITFHAFAFSGQII